MVNKKLITTGIFLLVILISIISIQGFSYIEEDDGTFYYETDVEIKAQKITIRDLITLQPKTEPKNPVFGVIYLDINSKKLRFFDGFDWYDIALEKDKVCDASRECKEWGDCINDYQTRTCLLVNEFCTKSKIIEKQDCSSQETWEEETREINDESPEIKEEDIEEKEESNRSDLAGEVINEIDEEREEEAEAEQTEEIEKPEGSIVSTITGEVVRGTKNTSSFLDFFKDITKEFINGFNKITGKVIELGKTETLNINFRLEEKSLNNPDKLVAFLDIQNFEKEEIPVRLFYTIKNKQDSEIHLEFEEIRVSKGHSTTKRFESLNLNYGAYTLILKIEYSGISKEFKEDFDIKKMI